MVSPVPSIVNQSPEQLKKEIAEVELQIQALTVPLQALKAHADALKKNLAAAAARAPLIREIAPKEESALFFIPKEKILDANPPAAAAPAPAAHAQAPTRAAPPADKPIIKPSVKHTPQELAGGLSKIKPS